MADKGNHDSPDFQRELSPESRKFGQIVMPKGSIRRPANTRSFNQLGCISHIKSLNPDLDDNPLHTLTREWLKTDKEELKEEVDVRLQRFLHDHDAYELKPTEPQFQELVKILLIGTEIQDLEEYEHVLEPRVVQRLRYLSRGLSEQSFIKHIGGKLTKTEEFLSCWNKRWEYWKSKDPVVDSVERSTEAKDDENCDKDIVPEIVMPPPRKRTLFTPKALASGKLLENAHGGFSPLTPSRKKRATPNSKSESPAAKRQRISRSETLSHEVMETPPPANLPPISPFQPSIHSNENANEHEDAVRFGQEFLSSPTPDPPEPATPQPKFSYTPVTPVDQDLSTRTPSHGSPSRNIDRSASVLRLAPQTPSASQRLPTAAWTPSRNPQITFIFQRPTGFYNLDDATPTSDANDFFSLNTAEFLQIAAERFGIDVEKLDCVTLRYAFEGFEVEIWDIHRDISLDAYDWDLLKENIKRQFHNSRMLNPAGKHFDVLVGPGESQDR